jgi:Ca2+-binding EF-hand superfamily protein
MNPNAKQRNAMHKQPEQPQTPSGSNAKKIGLGLCASLLFTTLSASVLAAHHEKGPIVLSEVEQRIDERFNTADVDSDGQLSEAELATIKPAHHKMKRKHKRMHKQDHPDTGAMFDVLDADGSGELSKDEFTAEKHRAARKQLKTEQRFAKLDANNSGSVERHEFGGRLERLRAADTDADGTVTRDEMRTARAAHRAQKQNDNS